MGRLRQLRASLAGKASASDPCWAFRARTHHGPPLVLPGGLPLGVTEAIMLAHGFTIEMLTVLVRDGWATATPEIVHAAPAYAPAAASSAPTPGRTGGSKAVAGCSRSAGPRNRECYHLPLGVMPVMPRQIP
jgi:hypothetical protein